MEGCLRSDAQTEHDKRTVKDVPMEEFGIRQSVTDFVADLVIICLYPKFLESDDVVVRPRERASNCRYAFMAVFRNVLQAPANK